MGSQAFNDCRTTNATTAGHPTALKGISTVIPLRREEIYHVKRTGKPDKTPLPCNENDAA
jgi:hypothetical protein